MTNKTKKYLLVAGIWVALFAIGGAARCMADIPADPQAPGPSTRAPGPSHGAATLGLSTSNITVAGNIAIGGSTIGQNSFTAQSTSTTQTTLGWFTTSGIGHVGNGGINEQIPIVVRNSTVFNTTALPGYAAGIDLVVSATRSAGANPLDNKGLFISVSGGQTNEAIDVTAGTSKFQDANFAGNTSVSASATFTSNGSTFLGDSSHDATVGRKLFLDGGNLLVNSLGVGTQVIAVGALGSATNPTGADLSSYESFTASGKQHVILLNSSLAGLKGWSIYHSTNGANDDFKFYNYNLGADAFVVAGADSSIAFTAGGSFGGALNMNSHLITNVTDPSSAQQAATKNYVDTKAVLVANLGNVLSGTGGDGVCNFDGVTTPVCGATLSGSTYTLARTVEATNFTVANNVIIAVNGWPIYWTGTLNGGGAGSKISAIGNAGAVTVGGTRSTNGSGWVGGTTANAGGAGGAATATAAGGSGQAQGNAINEWPTCSTARGTNSTSKGCGGGGGDGTAFGGVGGASTQSGAARGPTNIFMLLDGRDRVAGNLLTAGAGGGGGGSSSGTCTGGGGGAGGAWVVANGKIITGTITFTVAGGAGANAGAGTGTCGGGGGGAGGVIELSYSTATGASVTTTVSGGAAGTAVGGGVAGGTGFQGDKFIYSGDGT